jgi:hypothetical protein
MTIKGCYFSKNKIIFEYLRGSVLECQGKSFTVTQRICMERTIINLCVTVNHLRVGLRLHHDSASPSSNPALSQPRGAFRTPQRMNLIGSIYTYKCDACRISTQLSLLLYVHPYTYIDTNMSTHTNVLVGNGKLIFRLWNPKPHAQYLNHSFINEHEAQPQSTQTGSEVY